MKDLNHLQLINSRKRKLNLSRGEIVDRMGYKNKNKGYRLIDNVRKGELPRGSQVGLAKALNLDKTTLKSAIKKSKEQIEERKKEISREIFKPFLCSIGERSIPSPIFAGIMVDNQRYVYYEDEFMSLEKEKQL